MDVDDEVPTTSGDKNSKKRFEVKKWNAVALWAWDIVVDNCAICRNHIMDLCIECQAKTRLLQQAKNEQWLGESVIIPFISTAFHDG